MSMDKMREEYIRGTSHVGGLGGKVKETTLRWFGYAFRSYEEYIKETSDEDRATRQKEKSKTKEKMFRYCGVMR